MNQMIWQGTVTGRFSGHIENEANASKEIKRDFLSKQNTLVADFKSLEEQIALALKGSLESNVDVYTQMAADIFKIPVDNVTKDQRRYTKHIYFLKAYHALDTNIPTFDQFMESNKSTIASKF